MIKLDYRSRTPIYRQMEDSIIEMILLGVYQKGTQLPSVRSLAVELGINPNTIQKAYQELESQGIICSVTGKGSFVQGLDEAQLQLRRKALEALTAAVRDARLAGVPREEIEHLVEQEYQQAAKGGTADDRDRKSW